MESSAVIHIPAPQEPKVESIQYGSLVSTKANEKE